MSRITIHLKKETYKILRTLPTASHFCADTAIYSSNSGENHGLTNHDDTPAETPIAETPHSKSEQQHVEESTKSPRQARVAGWLLATGGGQVQDGEPSASGQNMYVGKSMA